MDDAFATAATQYQTPPQPAAPADSFDDAAASYNEQAANPFGKAADQFQKYGNSTGLYQAQLKQIQDSGHTLDDNTKVALLQQSRLAFGDSNLIQDAGDATNKTLGDSSDNTFLQNVGAPVQSAMAKGLTVPMSLVAPQTAAGLQQNAEQATAPSQPGSAGNIVGNIVGGAIQAAPAIAAGPAAPLVMAAQGAGQARLNVAQARNAGVNVSGGQEAMNVLASAAIQGGLGFATAPGGKALTGVLDSAIAKMTPEIVDAVATSNGKVLVPFIAQALSHAGVGATEGMVLNVAQNVADRVTGVDPKRDPFEGTGMAALQGGLLAGGHHLAEGIPHGSEVQEPSQTPAAAPQEAPADQPTPSVTPAPAAPSEPSGAVVTPAQAMAHADFADQDRQALQAAKAHLASIDPEYAARQNAEMQQAIDSANKATAPKSETPVPAPAPEKRLSNGNPTMAQRGEWKTDLTDRDYKAGDYVHGTDLGALLGMARDNSIQPSSIHDAQGVNATRATTDGPGTALSYAISGTKTLPAAIVIDPKQVVRNSGSGDSHLLSSVAKDGTPKSYVPISAVKEVHIPGQEPMSFQDAVKFAKSWFTKKVETSHPGDADEKAAALKKIADFNENFEKNQTTPKGGPAQAVGAALETSPEFEEPTASQGTKAGNEEMRAEHGIEPAASPEVRPHENLRDEAQQTLASDPDSGHRLVADLKDNPRPTTDSENTLLFAHQKQLENRFSSLNDTIDNSKDPAEVATARTALAGVRDDLQDTADVKKTGMTKTAQALSSNQLSANEGFGPAEMEVQKRTSLGRRLTPDEEDKIKDTSDKIKDADGKADEIAKERIQKEKKDQGDAIIEKFREEEPEPPEEPSDVPSGPDDFDEPGSDPDSKLPPDRSPEERKKEIIDRIQKRITDGGTPDDVRSLIQKLAREFVAGGVHEYDPLIDALHDALGKAGVDMEREDVADAFTGYGQYRPLKKDDVSATVRDLKGQGQQLAKIRDMLEKDQAPKKTGVEQREPSLEERQLRKKVEWLKKELNIQPTDPETQLKSALDAIKTRRENRIEELKDEIASGEKQARPSKPVQEDARSLALKDELTKLQAEHRAIFDKPMSDEDRLRLATKAAERNATAAEQRLEDAKKGTFPAEGKKALTSPELEAIRARAEAAREQFKLLDALAHPERQAELATQKRISATADRIADYAEKIRKGMYDSPKRPEPVRSRQEEMLRAEAERYKQMFRRGLAADQAQRRSVPEKIQDTFIKYRRAAVLSGPSVLAKLANAAVVRGITTPLRDMAITPFARLFKGVGGIAPRYHGFSAKAEARAIREGFTTGMKDAWQKLKTGESNLDTLFGKKNPLPHSVLDYVGNLHAALHAPVQRAEFERSMQDRIENGIRQGDDVHDPMVQTKYSLGAYKDSQREIFNEDSAISDAFKRAMSRFDNGEGGEKLAGTAIHTLLPVVKVPTNIIGQAFEHVFGLGTGAAKLVSAYRSGVENLKPEEADVIMRHLGSGSLGMAAMALGYLGYKSVGGFYQAGEKRDDKDVPAGKVRIFGHDLPSWMLDSPLGLALNAGATAHRVADEFVGKNNPATKGIFQGSVAALLGIVENAPIVKESVDVAKLLDPTTRGKEAARDVTGLVVPSIVSQAASATDSEKNPRKPTGVAQTLETQIPGARETVPVATQADLHGGPVMPPQYFQTHGDEIVAANKAREQIDSVASQYNALPTFAAKTQWRINNPDDRKLVDSQSILRLREERIDELRKTLVNPRISPETQAANDKTIGKLYKLIGLMVN